MGKREQETRKMYFWRICWRYCSRAQSFCSRKFIKEFRKQKFYLKG